MGNPKPKYTKKSLVLYHHYIHNYNIYNIGTGNGTSVLEMIQAFIKVTGLELNYIIGPRRQGDVDSAYADNSKAMKELNWKAENSIEDAILSAWNWEKKIRSL